MIHPTMVRSLSFSSIGLLCLGWAGWTATAVAAVGNSAWQLTTVVAGQTAPATEVERRKESDKWLRLARLSLLDGNLDSAESYLQRAEQLKVPYSGKDDKEDSPQSVRRDLAAARTGAPREMSPPPAIRRLPALPPNSAGTGAGAAPAAGSSNNSKVEALRLTSLARAALDRGELERARQLAQQAQQMNIPETAFAPGEIRPWMVLLEVDSAIQRRGGVVPASAQEPVMPGADRKTFPVSPGLYVPENDRSRVIMAATQEPNLAGDSGLNRNSPGLELYRQGVRALEQQDTQTAMQFFADAWKFEKELDPVTRQQLRDKLTLLRSSGAAARGSGEPSTLEEVDSKQAIVRSKLFREVTSEQAAAKQQSMEDPKGALERLQALRGRVETADLDQVSRRQLVAVVNRSISELEQYIETNRSEIELNERNAAVLKDISDRRARDGEVQTQLGKLVDEFNKLIDERRYSEAEVRAKQANELDPDNPVVQNMVMKARFAKQIAANEEHKRRSEQGFVDALTSVQRSSEPFDDSNPIQFDVTNWGQLSRDRRRFLDQQRSRFSPAEIKIRQRLKEKEVEVNYINQPLSEVIDSLTKLAQVNVHLDPQGLAAEGVSTDTPVTIQLQEPISLQSALELILEPLRLSYVIKHDVLLITSEQNRNSRKYPVTYYVADLVTPIPNFLPDFNVGLPNALREAYRVIGYGGGPNWYSGGIPTASADTSVGSKNKNILAQMQSASGGTPSMMGGGPQMNMSGPGGLGGAALADFDSLIELITSTIDPDSWTENGGSGAIEPFPTNLSLVISQTQEIHERVADLLEQLRRLQDLQVTIEVRFITLTDNFFERLGVDFDFNIEDNAPPGRQNLDRGQSTIIGLDRAGLPTPNLDIQVNQNSFNTAIPPFGGFQPANAASLGFAILSDIEVFFVLEAASADSRSNILQAPKVTLFNGQLASVFDGSTRPFVAGLIPVVGDFAVAHQPVIAVVHEGTSLSVQAVISADRRFVRLTLAPYFSQIRDVEEFTFVGRRTSDTGTNVTDDAGNPTGNRNNELQSTEGSTVQLPTVSSTSVSTTVSVPDGGTILLGGIKRLSEGRNEAGIPFLSKVPYINRLFRNVGIGRETQSLMLMVTPRIIIQEEEEERLGIKVTP